jgi:hypothetical protein
VCPAKIAFVLDYLLTFRPQHFGCRYSTAFVSAAKYDVKKSRGKNESPPRRKTDI